MYMLDTDTCIFIMNRRHEALRHKFQQHGDMVCISSITHAELCYGVAHSSRIEENSAELESFCLDLNVLPFDRPAGTHYGDIRHVLTARGEPIGGNDLLIAGHARSVGAALITSNVREFRRVPGLRIENWLSDIT